MESQNSTSLAAKVKMEEPEKDHSEVIRCDFTTRVIAKPRAYHIKRCQQLKSQIKQEVKEESDYESEDESSLFDDFSSEMFD